MTRERELLKQTAEETICLMNSAQSAWYIAIKHQYSKELAESVMSECCRFHKSIQIRYERINNLNARLGKPRVSYRNLYQYCLEVRQSQLAAS